MLWIGLPDFSTLRRLSEAMKSDAAITAVKCLKYRQNSISQKKYELVFC